MGGLYIILKKTKWRELVNTFEYLYCQILRNWGLIHQVLCVSIYCLCVQVQIGVKNLRFHKSLCCHLRRWNHKITQYVKGTKFVHLRMNTSFLCTTKVYMVCIGKEPLEILIGLCLTSNFFYVLFVFICCWNFLHITSITSVKWTRVIRCLWWSWR